MPALTLSTIGLIFLAELTDKTALATLVLAVRYPGRQVVIGAWLALLVQTLVAVAAGSLLQSFPAHPARIAGGLGFFAFAVITLRRDERQELRQEALYVARASHPRWAPWISSFLVVLAVEWGDLTQLATASLVADTGQPIPVALGAIAALWSVTILAVTAGSRLASLVAQKALSRAGATLFAGIGAFMIATAYLG